MIIFLYGADGYRLKENIDTIVGSYRKKHKSGVNFHTFDFDQRTSVKLAIASFTEVGDCFDGLYNAVKNVSFFDEVKLIVVKNAFSNKTSSQNLIALINDLNINIDKKIVLLFAENKDKKELQKANKNLLDILNRKDSLVKEIELLDRTKLSNWIKNKFKENGRNVSPSVVDLLVGAVGNESWALANEINKLSNYAYHTGQTNISERDVELLVNQKESGKIFDLVDAVGSQNKAKAFEMVYRLTNSGHDAHYLLSMLVYHFENLLSISDFMKNGDSFSIQLIAKQCGLHPFVAGKAVSQARKFSEGLLLDKFNYLGGLDILSKNGQVNLEDALYNFVISP